MIGSVRMKNYLFVLIVGTILSTPCPVMAMAPEDGSFTQTLHPAYFTQHSRTPFEVETDHNDYPVKDNKMEIQELPILHKEIWNDILGRVIDLRRILLGNETINSLKLVCTEWNKLICEIPTKYEALNNTIYPEGFFGQFPNLQTLTIKSDREGRPCSLVADNHINGLTQLTELNVNKGLTQITDEGVSTLTNIRILRIYPEHKNITHIGISGLTNLRILDICSKLNFTSAIVSLFMNLTELDLDANSNITDDALSRFTNLRRLGLFNNHTITDKGLSGLTNLTSLALFNVGGVSDKGFHFLTNLTNLNLCHNSKITDEGLSPLTNLRKLGLRTNYKITYKGLSFLTKLEELDLSYNINIIDEGLSVLTNLTELDLEDNSTITDLRRLTKLKEVHGVNSRTDILMPPHLANFHKEL